MKLTIKDRYILLQLLPQTGTFSTIRAVDKVRKALAPSPEEVKEYKIHDAVTPDGKPTVNWDKELDDKEVDIEIPAAGFEVLKDAMKKMDTEGKLPVPWVETLEKLDAIVQAPK